MNGDMYVVDHLQQDGSNDDFWKSLTKKPEDVCEEQFIDVKVDGTWEIEKVSGNRIISRYHLKNCKEIDNAFKKME